MSMKVDEATRVISNQDRTAYLEMKYKRDMNRRVAKLERLVEDLSEQIQGLTAKEES